MGKTGDRAAATKAAVSRFGDHLAGRGLRLTRQRRVVADAFLSVDGHLSADDLLERVRARERGIGPATVYRTLKLLREAGLARGMSAGDGLARYEPPGRGGHHDHLICRGCGRIVEFENDQIEALQERVAARHGFTVVDHRLELYGVCGACRGGRG